MDEPAAYRWLQRASMDGRTTMRAVAEGVLAEGVLAEGVIADGADQADPKT